MSQLITVTQIAQYKQMTVNINAEKLVNPYIMEAQEFDLRPMLGDEFYLAFIDDFVASPSLQEYEAVYSGSTYTYQGKTYKHEGIVPILAYFAYARYAKEHKEISTGSGFRVKRNDSSDLASDVSISGKVSQARSGGVVYQERLKLFLDRNASDYPLWESCNSSNRRKGSIRVTAIGQGRSNYCHTCNYQYNYCICGHRY